MSEKKNIITTTEKSLSMEQKEELEIIGRIYRKSIYSQYNFLQILESFISEIQQQKGEICQTILSEIIRYKLITQDRAFFALLRKWIDELYNILEEILPDNVSYTIECRRKSAQSTIRKILINHLEGSSIDLSDLVAFRIVVDSLNSKSKQKEFCYIIKDECINFFKSKLCTLCRPLKSVGHNDLIKDYIEEPKPNGYQSLHLSFKTINNHIFEVQIRTLDMHEHAELGDASHSGYKNIKESLVKKYIYFDIDKVKLAMFRRLENGSLYDQVGLHHAFHIEKRSKTF